MTISISILLLTWCVQQKDPVYSTEICRSTRKDRDLHKGPRKVPALHQAFFKGRDLPCHITQVKDPVHSADLQEGPGKTPALPQNFPKGRDFPCHILHRKDKVQILAIHEGPWKERGPSWRPWNGSSSSQDLSKG